MKNWKMENVVYFKYMGSVMTNDARCAHQITSRDSRSESSIQEKEDSFHQETGINLRKKLVICYIMSMALHGSKTWTLRKVIRNNLEVFICGAGEGWRRSVVPIM